MAAWDGDLVWEGLPPLDPHERKRLLDLAFGEAAREYYSDPAVRAEDERLMNEFESADRQAWAMLDEEDGGSPVDAPRG